MTTRNSAVVRLVIAVLTVTAIAFVPWTTAMADANLAGVSVKDGTEFLNNQGDGSSIQSVHSYARSNYIWPYASGPSYPSIDVYQQGVLWTTAGVFQLQEDLSIASELRSSVKLNSFDAQYYAVAFHTDLGVLESLRGLIESEGGIFVESPSDGIVVAKLNASALLQVQSAVGFLAAVPYHGAFKLDSSIGRNPLPDPIKALSDTYTLEISLWPGEDAAAVAQQIIAIGADVTRNYPDSLIAEVHRNQLRQVADIDAIRAIHEDLPRFQLGEETTSVMQHWAGTWIGATPYNDAGVTGAGLGLCANNVAISCTFDTEDADCGLGQKCLAQQVLMVLDSGFQLDAGDLSDSRTDAGTPSSTHRKVRVMESTNQFGGSGDTNGCDAPPQGGFTHGHVVAATALGNATNVDPSYGAPFFGFDQQNNAWELDGVARGAVVVGYDGQITPSNGSCSDPLLDSIIPGDLYAGGGTGSLGESYVQHDARITNFSWGQQSNVYNQNSGDVDQFMRDKGDALVFVSAGNAGVDNVPVGGDGIPDPGSLGAPATTKNGFAIGASRNANTVNSPESRAFFSSVGPAVNTTVNRVAPQLMAPGDEPGGGSLGISSEFSCRSNDNDQANPVACDIVAGVEGTSFASPAAAGAALLVRDYFQQGFHPDAHQNPADSIEIGSALNKAILIASADFMTGANLSRAHRWNNEQGYGRIQLDHALPLETWSRSPTGLLIHDPFSSATDLGLGFTVTTGQLHSQTFEVCNDDEELRVALAWIDSTTGGAPLRNDLDLTLISPSGIEYRGNYFTDDDNQNGIPEGIDGCNGNLADCEDCGGIGAADINVANQLIDQSRWSLPVCDKTSVLGKNLSARTYDNANPTEAIFLSNDPEGDNLPNGGNPGTGGLEGTCTPLSSTNANGPCDNNLDCRTAPLAAGVCVNPKDYQQTELGVWTIEVKHQFGLINEGPQPFAVAVAGGVCLGSVARFDDGNYTCNERAFVTVNEIVDLPLDGNPSEADVEGRTTIQVLDSTNTVVDTETNINFTQVGTQLKYESDPLQLTDGTARDPGNGALDIRDGDTIRVSYQDIDPDTGLVGNLRTNTATIGCKVEIGFGAITFGQFGQDSSTLVLGGCERNVRNQFEFGFPDRYMDAGENLIFNFAFRSNEGADLQSLVATLSCVNVDLDSPAQCLPSGAGCEESGGTAQAPSCNGNVGPPAPCDPLRLNNTACDWLDVLAPALNVGFLPAGVAISANYAIVMAGDGAGEPFEDTGGGQPTPTVEMLLELEAAVSGKTASALAVSRQQLNRDTLTTLYSTDFPTGGTEVIDTGPGSGGNNNEIAQDPITEIGTPQGNDYRFETFVFGDLTAGGTKNTNLLAPWKFDGNNGGFTVGLAAPSDETAADIFNIANWGEDKNFNNIEDGFCLTDPATACYNFPSDIRCPVGNPVCLTTENNDPLNQFAQNWNTKGGCGWQTRATGECSGDVTRGCFGNDDCLGTCHVSGNDIASGFEPCLNNGACPTAPQCSGGTNPLGPCPNGGVDCPGGVCANVTQSCDGEAGTCGAVSGDHTGGIWHTGVVGTPNLACTGGAGSACANYKVIASTNGQLLWWELLVTPEMRKVNTNVNPDGTNEATIEILDWAWNSQINLSDENTGYSWEFDTDLAALEPVDLFSDGGVLGLSFGAYGAVSEGSNPDLTRGWPIFAPQGFCSTGAGAPCDGLDECEAGSCAVSTDPCHVNADCGAGACTVSGDPCFSNADCGANTCTNPAPEGCTNAPICDFTGANSFNGGPGNNSRVGKAGCFFEGNVSPTGFGDLGHALPVDDDQDNDGDLTVDEYIQDDGPYRNHDVVAFNGPDMRFTTLEDFFGDTGDSFQAAIGFLESEGTTNSVAQQSYGMGVDDMVVKWKEFTLEADSTDCALSGSCAVMQLSTTNVFQGQAVLSVTVLEPVPSVNDCDLDGTPDATFDCNGNGTPDLVVKASSDAEVSGEIIFLDQGTATSEYTGNLIISVLSDSPGVLFLAREGVNNPTVTVTYVDKDIDPGPGVELCPNDVDPAKHGIIQDFNTVFVDGACEVVVVSSETADNGDGDFFPDTEETVDMTVCLINNCGGDLHNCTGRLFSNSPEVDCILDSTISVGDLTDVEDIVCITDTFQWKVADVNRSSVDDVFEAAFNMTMTCDEIDSLSVSQQFTVSLDLDLNDLGQTPAAWVESFESATLGKFFAENLDAGIPGANNAEGLINGDGFRCQFSDPDWVNANNYGDSASEDCYPGNTVADSNKIHWNVDGTLSGSPDGGRSFDGDNSLYYGVYLTDPAGQFTTPSAVIESVATINPINLGVNVPELSYWQQVSMMDNRGLNMNNGRSADNGVVQGKLVNGAGADTTPWFNLHPFQNDYDTQQYDNYFACFFDPVDDGTTEDDFFDPADPSRRQGPSSTCAPEFSASFMGATVLPFSTESGGSATTPPGPGDDPALNGGYGVGTWVQSKVALAPFRGQRMKLRYLVANMKFSPDETWESAFAPDFNPDARDDGWWVDDIRVDESLASPALLEVDVKNLAHCSGNVNIGCFNTQDCIDNGTTGPCVGNAPQCGPTCTSLLADVLTIPDETGGALDELLAAPGQPITLDASASSGVCIDGSLQYRFSKGGTVDVDPGPGVDIQPVNVLRGFSENPIYIDAPQVDTTYLVETRCSTDGPAFSCSDDLTALGTPTSWTQVFATVNCPTSGTPLLGDFTETILASGDCSGCPLGCPAACKAEWSWTTSQFFELLQGPLATVSSYSGTTSTGAGTSFSSASTVPGTNPSQFYVIREVGSFCNEVGSWSSNECELGTAPAGSADTHAPWWPAPGSGNCPNGVLSVCTGLPPTCARDTDIP